MNFSCVLSCSISDSTFTYLKVSLKVASHLFYIMRWYGEYLLEWILMKHFSTTDVVISNNSKELR